MANSPTRFRAVSPWAARLWLAGGIALLAWGWIVSLDMTRWRLGMPGTFDLEFYRDVVERVRAGQSYADAFDASVGHFGLVISSPFNRRPPTYAWMLATMPDLAIAYGLLLLLSLVAALLGVWFLIKPWAGTRGQASGLILLMGGSFAWLVYQPDSFLATEPWCETLLLLSLVAYARGHWPVGMAASLFALALRELALPWCVVAWGVSIRKKRWTEATLWTIAIVLYAILLAYSVRDFERRYPAPAREIASDWTRTNGLAFVMRSSVMNVALRPLPVELIAIYLPLALLGLASWPGELGRRMLAIASIYLIAFLVIQGGDYWGQFFTPLLALGLIRSPGAVRDLLKRATGRADQVALTAPPPSK